MSDKKPITKEMERQTKEIELACRIYDDMKTLTEPILLCALKNHAKELLEEIEGS